jgi:hypothetical protein
MEAELKEEGGEKNIKETNYVLPLSISEPPFFSKPL